VANSNKRNNAIESLSINGSLSSDANEINAHIVHFYTQLFTESCSRRPIPDGLLFKSIGSEESLWLERDFEENEVLEVIKELQGDKSPRPDGFSLDFMRTCWEKLQRDFLWGGLHEEPKFHLVKWAQICTPMHNGGLGKGDGPWGCS
jgi:hypothetical protein